MAIVFLGSTQNISAQGNPNFKDIFEKETQSSARTQQRPQFKNITELSFLPDTLPLWFFNPPRPPHGKIFSIGISDPDLPLEDAYRQAIHRAKAKAGIFNSARIEYFRDFFSSAQHQTNSHELRERFDTYFRISANTNTSIKSYSINNQHITQYNEFIVLMSLDLSPLTDSTSISVETHTAATVLYIEVQLDDVFEPQAEYTLTTTQRFDNKLDSNSEFSFIERGNRYQSTSTYMGKTIDFPTYPYRYAQPSASKSSEPLVYYEGLWSVYMKDFLRHLCLTSEQSSFRIRSLSQHYTPETTNLSREVATFDVEIHLNGIVFGRDSVGFDLQLREPESN